jgi:hypothetical protein
MTVAPCRILSSRAEIANGRRFPSDFGIYVRREGCGRYAPRWTRVVGMDIHRTFAEVVTWEQGKLRRAGRVDMTRTALEGFGKTLQASDEVVVAATGNTMAAS